MAWQWRCLHIHKVPPRGPDVTMPRVLSLREFARVFLDKSNTSPRIMGVDYGEKRTGLAITADPACRVAVAVGEVVRASGHSSKGQLRTSQAARAVCALVGAPACPCAWRAVFFVFFFFFVSFFLSVCVHLSIAARAVHPTNIHVSTTIV